jgi:ADP-heptose:LPS heptosyltransferase
MSEKVKFLVVRFSSIGDIVLTSSVIRMLKKQVKNSVLHFVTKKAYYDVVKHNPYIDKIHLFDRDFSLLVEELKDEYFDYVIDLHHNLRTYRLKNKLGILAFSFDKINWEKWLMVNFRKNILPPMHIVDRYLNTTKAFDVQNDNLGLDYFLSKDDEIVLSDYQLEPNNYLAFAIGATHATKRLPNEKIGAILSLIKQKVVLLGGPDDVENARQAMLGIDISHIVNLCGRIKLNQSAYMVKNAAVVLTHDTGLMHIAAAFQKKIVSVWGNTIPAFGMTPYMPADGSKIIEVNNLNCRPCTKIGFSACPKRHFKCMNLQNEQIIVDACKW